MKEIAAKTRETPAQPKRLFSRNFSMVVIGQIISLFGNTILRYALPLYLLNQTHSASLFGIVSAAALLPMVLLAPVGGIVADRVNKRNVMVVLDFATAGVVALYTLQLGRFDLVPPLVVTLMLLYGIQGAYQPAVQSSLPALVSGENLNAANAVVNMVNSLAGLVGPVCGGVVYAAFGIRPILYISIACFLCSAVMEIFIRIPFQKRAREQGVLRTAAADMRAGLRFMLRENSMIGKMALLFCAVNMVFSALIMISVPVIITEKLEFPAALGNRLYGYAQGALALGGLAGGLIIGVFGKRFKVRRVHRLFFVCTLSLLPIALVLLLKPAPMVTYGILTAACFVMMMFSTMLSVEMMAYVQRVTPGVLIGKVVALVGCMCMCASPLGQMAYGFLFEHFADALYWIFFAAFAICLVFTAMTRRLARRIPAEADAG